MVTIGQLDELLTAMVQSAEGISDLLFVPGKPPQVEVNGVLEPFAVDWPEPARAVAHVEGLARTIIADNPKLLRDLAERGSCDCSYALKDVCRFRINIYRQNGSHAMVMRRIPPLPPTMESLGLPPVFYDTIKEKNGLIFVTGASGNGKTTTLAALLNEINRQSRVHVVTLEDPVEFLHPHLNATFSQREMGQDFYTFPDGLRAALRQAPKVILVGEIRDPETMEIALTAGETGHVVYCTLHTISVSQTINRILGMFQRDEEHQIRERLASSLRYIIGQRLVPKKTGGRLLVTEVMGNNLRTHEAIAMGESENRRLADIIDAARHAGWHSFEHSLLKACEQELITEETAMLYSNNKAQMRQMIDLSKSQARYHSGPASQPTMISVPAASPPPLASTTTGLAKDVIR
jgi:twitching motility protein PilT